MCLSPTRLPGSFGAAVLLALVLASAACAEARATSTGFVTHLAPGRDPIAERIWRTGSLRQSIEPYPDIWVVADIKQRSDLERIAMTSRRERVHYRPAVGEAFEVVEDQERPAPSRSVECALEALPGERIGGDVIEVKRRPSSNYPGSLVVDVDNSHGWLLPGMHLAMAVQTDGEPVMLAGIAELPRDCVTAAPLARASLR
jgi:hypothetical protein